MAVLNPNELAAKVLRDKIAAKEQRIKELDKLLAERNQLASDIGMLRQILEREFNDLELDSPPSGPADTEPLPPDLGLSAAIRLVLESPTALNGLRPIEVSDELERRGWQNTGKVPMGARVAAEMARLARTGKLYNMAGRYRLPPGG